MKDDNTLNIGHRLDNIIDRLGAARLIWGDDEKLRQSLSLARLSLNRLIDDLRKEIERIIYFSDTPDEILANALADGAETTYCPKDLYIHTYTPINTPEDFQKALDNGNFDLVFESKDRQNDTDDFYYHELTAEDDKLIQDLQKAISNGTIRPVFLDSEELKR